MTKEDNELPTKDLIWMEAQTSWEEIGKLLGADSHKMSYIKGYHAGYKRAEEQDNDS